MKPKADSFKKDNKCYKPLSQAKKKGEDINYK